MLLRCFGTQTRFEQVLAEGAQNLGVACQHVFAHLIQASGHLCWLQGRDDPLALLNIAICLIEITTDTRAKEDGIRLQQAIIDNLIFKWQQYGLDVDGDSGTNNLFNGTDQPQHTVGMSGRTLGEEDRIFFEMANDEKVSSKPVLPAAYQRQVVRWQSGRIVGDETFAQCIVGP